MKILALLLLSFTAFSQTRCPDDMWSSAVIVHDTPLEIQVGPGVAFRSVVIERKDTTKTETWVIYKKGTTAPIPEPVLKTTVDDPQLQYSAKNPTVNPSAPSATSWNTFNKTVAPFPAWTDNFHNDTGTFSNALNTTVSLTFTGKKVRVWGEISDNKGIAGIKLNAEPEITKDLYAATGVNNSKVIYESAVLPQGNHSVTIRVTGNKNTASSGTYVLIDKVEVFE